MQKNSQVTEPNQNSTSDIPPIQNCLTSGFLSSLINDFSYSQLDISNQLQKSRYINKEMLYQKVTSKILTKLFIITQKIQIYQCFQKWRRTCSIFKKKQLRTYGTIAKTLYKLQLTLNMKFNSKLSYSLSKLRLFTKNNQKNTQQIQNIQNNLIVDCQKVQTYQPNANFSDSKIQSIVQIVQIIESRIHKIKQSFFLKIKKIKFYHDKIQILIWTINTIYKQRNKKIFQHLVQDIKTEILIKDQMKQISQLKPTIVTEKTIKLLPSQYQRQINSNQNQSKQGTKKKILFQKYIDIERKNSFYHNEYGICQQQRDSLFFINEKQDLVKKSIKDKKQLQKSTKLSFNRQIKKKSKSKIMRSKKSKDKSLSNDRDQYKIQLKYIPILPNQKTEQIKKVKTNKRQKSEKAKIVNTNTIYISKQRKTRSNGKIKTKDQINNINRKMQINFKKLNQKPTNKVIVIEHPLPKHSYFKDSQNIITQKNNINRLKNDTFKEQINDIGDFLFIKDLCNNKQNILNSKTDQIFKNKREQKFLSNPFEIKYELGTPKSLSNQKQLLNFRQRQSKISSQKYIPELKFNQRQIQSNLVVHNKKFMKNKTPNKIDHHSNKKQTYKSPLNPKFQGFSKFQGQYLKKMKTYYEK